MNNLPLRIGAGALALGAAAVLGLPPLLGASGASSPAGAAASVAPADGYAVAGGCYDLYSQTARRLVAKTGGAYVASATTPAVAYGIRMQAAALGSYVLDGKDGRFVTGASATKLATGLYVGPARAGGARFVYLVRGGSIHAVAVASRAETQSAARLGGDLRAAGLS